MKAFEYARAASVDEVVGALQHDRAVRPLAGGTDLLPLVKADLVTPARLVDIKRAAGLDGEVRETPNGLRLGALTTVATIETHPLIRSQYPVLAEAAAIAASPQLRHMATLGGNLLQRPRCWYFRSRLFHCWLKGGDVCPAKDGENRLHAIFGGGPCYAVHPSDLANALLALDASVRVRGRDGDRVIALADFFALPTENRRVETTLRPDELLTAVQIPKVAAATRGVYLKAMDRKVWAFALVSVAALLTLEGERIADARLVLGGVAPVPWRVPAAERLLVGASPSAALFEQVADTALVDAQPLTENGYKIPLAKSLIQRALSALG